MDRTVMLPYGRTQVPVTLDSKRITCCLEPESDDADRSRREEEIVCEALRNPIGTARLSELAGGKRNVVIIISDHTRPVPSREILPPVLKEIRQASPDARIRLLVATGCHRGTTAKELMEKLGEDICHSTEIVVHDCDDSGNLTGLGMLPSGQELRINRIAAEADLLIAEGFIEPHFFAGFSGGRKSVLPGIASRESVLGNHCAEFIDSPFARAGITEGNPIDRDMKWAAEKAGLKFIINVVLNREKRIVRAFAGDPIAAHAEGCRYVRNKYSVSGPLSDIVITTNGGYPLDQNVYQSVKGMSSAEPLCRQGGVIIVLAKCNDGIGGENFYHQIADCSLIEDQLKAFRRRKRGETLPDQWQSQIFFRVLNKARVILMSDMPPEAVRKMKMYPAEDVGTALSLAEQLVGSADASVAIIPDGVSVIVSAK